MSSFNLCQKWRVFEFEVPSYTYLSEGRLFAIDRNDGLREELITLFDRDAIGECRPRNIGFLINENITATVVTRCDPSGIAAAEIIRMLNNTGYRGQLVFGCDEKTAPLHLTRRLKKLAIDFDLSTCPVTNLVGAETKKIATADTGNLVSAMG